MEITTAPIALHPFTVADAERLLAGDVDPLDGWEGGYSFTDEPELLAEYLRSVRRDGDPAPYGPYLVRRVGGAGEGAAIGGVNLFGPPDERGAVEFGFGLVPAARGQGLSRHVVAETIELLRSAGAAIARADCEIANLPARRVLEQAGLVEVGRTSDLVTLEIRL
ncbi:GNAT family N-acetyltransferase [Agromyces aurantiacus]|uniref:GNAT family N-acetyltransferase n=1 Tax=Agromyces aurantiacus TaxID=165814 RepID=A0ABV9R3G8_9MICO|nr:GNAT family N-acetyltransferase [Agromyces aurantiacus]MBM7502845.1 RimJ/RimL family protein N-acetyltransferase [Agromyces aurantiacus]